VLTTDAQEDPRFEAQESIVAHNLRSILCVPLKVKDELTGVIYTDNRMQTGTFSKKELDLLHNFADQAAVALENARLFASVKRTLAEVTELKNLMDNVFASIASGVITTDTEDKITLCNRAAENMLCHSAKELVGHTLEEVFPSLAPFLTSPIYSVRQTDVPIIGLEVSPQLPPRGEVNLRFNLSPLKDAEQNTQGVAIVIDDLTEQKRLEALHRLFERMVSPAVIQQLDPETIQLGGERTMITVLFADVQGFTGYSENRDPEELVSVLNQYLAAGAEAILKQQGTIDKFLGDAIMAWFNAPIPQPDHTLRAIKAALSMREAIQHLHRRLPPEFRLTFGIGIHYGEAVLGLVGSEHRCHWGQCQYSQTHPRECHCQSDIDQLPGLRAGEGSDCRPRGGTHLR
jgi:PAS domain S-box-containing protein